MVSKSDFFSPSKFTSAPQDASQQSCRVPEHSIHDEAVLKRTWSSSWPLSKLQNTLEKMYFKDVIPWLTVLLELRKEVKERYRATGILTAFMGTILLYKQLSPKKEATTSSRQPSQTGPVTWPNNTLILKQPLLHWKKKTWFHMF